MASVISPMERPIDDVSSFFRRLSISRHGIFLEASWKFLLNALIYYSSVYSDFTEGLSVYGGRGSSVSLMAWLVLDVISELWICHSG
jgi:hypothetical protein